MRLGVGQSPMPLVFIYHGSLDRDNSTQSRAVHISWRQRQCRVHSACLRLRIFLAQLIYQPPVLGSMMMNVAPLPVETSAKSAIREVGDRLADRKSDCSAGEIGLIVEPLERLEDRSSELLFCPMPSSAIARRTAEWSTGTAVILILGLRSGLLYLIAFDTIFCIKRTNCNRSASIVTLGISTFICYRSH